MTIGMKYRLDKPAKVTFKTDKLTHTFNIQIDNNNNQRISGRRSIQIFRNK